MINYLKQLKVMSYKLTCKIINNFNICIKYSNKNNNKSNNNNYPISKLYSKSSIHNKHKNLFIFNRNNKNSKNSSSDFYIYNNNISNNKSKIK